MMERRVVFLVNLFLLWLEHYFDSFGIILFLLFLCWILLYSVYLFGFLQPLRFLFYNYKKIYSGRTFLSIFCQGSSYERVVGWEITVVVKGKGLEELKMKNSLPFGNHRSFPFNVYLSFILFLVLDILYKLM